MDTNLDKEFKELFKKMSECKKSIAPDVMLKLYAFYKQATVGDTNNFVVSSTDVKDAFKVNAWTQINGMSQEDAKKEYISLAKEVIKTKK